MTHLCHSRVVKAVSAFSFVTKESVSLFVGFRTFTLAFWTTLAVFRFLLLHSIIVALLSLSLDCDGILVDQFVGIDRHSKVIGSQVDDCSICAIAGS